jgi:uncharacterized coiled-coil DUF342 family protein
MNETREAYVQELKALMDELNAEIDKLEARADRAKAEVSLKYLQQVEDLREKRKEVEDQAAKLQQAGEGAWEDLKQGVEDSWKILKTSFKKAKSEFERGYREGRAE